MNTECFLKYLQFLRDQYPNNRNIHLIIDSYSSHTSKASKNRAEFLNIQLYYIPSHFTDLLQPFDVAIFAPLKSMANSKIRHLLIYIDKNKIGMKKSVFFLQEAWENLPESTLKKTRNQYL